MGNPDQTLINIRRCIPEHFCCWNGTSILHCQVSAFGEPMTAEARLLLTHFYDWVRVTKLNKEKITNIMIYIHHNKVTKDDIEEGLHNFLREIHEYDLDLWGGREPLTLELLRDGKFL